MSNDFINAGFEVAGALFAWLNVRRLYTDREVRGYSWLVVLFFTAWGLWNIYYYPSLGQVLSGAAAVMLVFVNALWLALLFYYSYLFRWHDGGH